MIDDTLTSASRTSATPETAQAQALRTYNGAADVHDDPANSFCKPGTSRRRLHGIVPPPGAFPPGVSAESKALSSARAKLGSALPAHAAICSWN